MKIGVISDIHGDLEALATVLDRLDHFHKVDHILCAGDLVGRGPEEDRVVEIFRKRGIPTVRGNHDEWFYGLTEENTKFLKHLPLDLQLSVGGVDIFMCHGKPGSNMWGLYRDHISDTLLNMMLESLGTSVLITGHTHVPMFIKVERGVVINPGSVYNIKSSRASSRTYGVLTVPELQFELFDLTAKGVEPVEVKQYR